MVLLFAFPTNRKHLPTGVEGRMLRLLFPWTSQKLRDVWFRWCQLQLDQHLWCQLNELLLSTMVYFFVVAVCFCFKISCHVKALKMEMSLTCMKRHNTISHTLVLRSRGEEQFRKGPMIKNCFDPYNLYSRQANSNLVWRAFPPSLAKNPRDEQQHRKGFKIRGRWSWRVGTFLPPSPSSSYTSGNEVEFTEGGKMISKIYYVNWHALN